MRITGLGYIGFNSPAAETWRSFGPEVLGLELGEGPDRETVYLRMDDRHHRLAIHPGSADRLAYVGWETQDSERFGEALTHLERCCVKYVEATAAELEDRCVSGMVHFEGPAGYRHELFYGQGERYKSFHPGRRHGGFVTGDQGMGHVVLVTPTLQEDHEFVEQVLGFKTVVSVGTETRGFRFYRCNPRHHCFAAMGKPGKRGLLHLMIQVADLDDVGVALDAAQARGLEIPITLGRHPGDYMVSFYVRTPSNFDLEYGWDGLRIDDEAEVTETRWFGPTEVWGHQRVGDFLPANVEDAVGPSGD